ncbi:hypothetical protein [Pseudonocardia sp. GCM10023141]|uniref:hypothetical protein n=1 Tax=Pseudonocardia sp. GCM10023141 TaxID=3252653 RepID=UPI00361A2A96
MGVVSRAARLVLVAGMATVAVGCGGSVADADAPIITRTVVPQTPFCQAVQANSDALRPLNSAATRGVGGPDDLKQAGDAVRRTGSDLVALAPSDLSKDVQRIVDALNLQVDALVAAGGRAVQPSPEAAAQLNSPELLSANQRVNAYVSRACGRTPSTTSR